MIRNLVSPLVWLSAAVALTLAVPPTATAQKDDDRRRRAISESLKRIQKGTRPSARPSTRSTQRPAQRIRVNRMRPQTRRPVLERATRSTPPAWRPPVRQPTFRRPEARQDIGRPVVRGSSARESIPSRVADYRTRSSAGTGRATGHERVAEYRPELPPMSPDWRATPDRRREADRDDRRARPRGPYYRDRYRDRYRHRYRHRIHHRRHGSAFHRFGHHNRFHRFGGFRFHSGHWHFVIVVGGPRVVRSHHNHYHHHGHRWWDGSHTALQKWDRSHARRVAGASYDFSGATCVELRLRTRVGEEHRVEIDPRRWNARDPGDLYAALWAQLDREGYLEVEGLDGVLHVFPEGLLQEIEAAPCH